MDRASARRLGDRGGGRYDQAMHAPRWTEVDDALRAQYDWTLMDDVLRASIDADGKIMGERVEPHPNCRCSITPVPPPTG